ncbi:MAG TPA: hypothetical protein VHK69_08985 [Chitinophagaceae bacterium]|jgi:uncharacterized protein YjiK|nr:hypothetical protein [Chitinophagaceae bacterium]
MRFGVLIAIVVVTGGFIFHRDITGLVTGAQPTVVAAAKAGKKENKKKGDEPAAADVQIRQKWELPDRLKEVSGIAYLDGQRFVCVQDEEGTVFVFNRQTGAIEKELPFGPAGDYEGITLHGQTVYVVRADGHLFEVPLNGGKPVNYATPLTAEHNVEGLCYDGAGNRLLLAVKDEEPGGQGYKGVYAFDLKQKKLREEPVLRIEAGETAHNGKGGKKNKGIRPSAIGIHPLTRDIYVVDGPQAGLLIMDAAGTVKQRLSLGKAFAQPEGLTFSPEGEAFISNEGPKAPANIIQVQIQ